MANSTISSLPPATSIDAVNDYLVIDTASPNSTNKINRNTLLALSSQPLGLNDIQSPTNKSFNNSNTYTIKDGSLTIQNSSSVTKQAQFSLSPITAGQTRTITIPDSNGTLALLGSVQIFTAANSFSGSSWSGGSIDNATITVDSIAGHTNSTTGNIYGVGITAGQITSTSSVLGAALTNSSVTASKIALGVQTSSVATSEQTSSTSYTDLPTVGPSVTVTIGANGLALVCLLATMNSDTANANCYMSVLGSGSNTVATSDAQAIQITTPSGGGLYSVSSVFVLTGLTAGTTTFKAQYRVGSHTGTFASRRLAVIPL